VLILILAIVVSMSIGVMTGGKVSNLARTKFRYLPLLILALMVQILIFSELLGREPIIHRIGPYIHIATLATSFGVMVMNRHIPGMKIIMIGAGLNLLVITANGGFMPISESALRIAGQEEEMLHHTPRHDSEDYLLPNSRLSAGKANLLFLGDAIPFPEGWPIATVVSIGDLILAAGAGTAVILGMRRRDSEDEEDESTLVLHESNRNPAR
jgi:hypothetical protein